ncbi:MAG: hypothetical protein AABO57_12250 [Acidobacteriota bacterium]
MFCLIHSSAYAQAPTEEYKIANVSFTNFPAQKYIDVRFSDRLDRRHPEDLNSPNVQIKSAPSNTPITAVSSVSRDPFTPRNLRITLSGSPAIPATDIQVQVCFTKLNFLDPAGKPHATSAQVCGTGDILNPENIAAQLEKQYEVLLQTPKTSTEKNIFASGFAAKGEGNDAQGGAEIHLNSNDLGVPGLTVAMHLDKTTADNADPKYFQSGITYRSSFLIGAKGADQTREQLAIIRNPASTPQQIEEAKIKVDELTKQRQAQLWGAVLLDVASNLEGQAMDLEVTNFVGDATIQLVSRTKTLLGSKKGFWKLRFLGGMEGGKNLNTGNDAQQAGSPQQMQELQDVNYIARSKFGGALTFFYSDPETRFPFKRVEADIRGVDRYLFLSEVKFDEMTKLNVMTDKGHKPWFQTDLKFYLSDTPTGRLGFKLSYKRGSLPPVFANTNSFQFGFVIETADDTAKTR